MKGGRRWYRRGAAGLATALVATGLVGSLVPSSRPAAADPPADLQPDLVTRGGFSSGAALEVGLAVADVAWDPVGARLVVADCETVRAIDPVAGTSTLLALAADVANPDGLPTFVGRAAEVAVDPTTPAAPILVGLTEGACSDLYWDHLARLAPSGPATVVAGGASTAAAGLDVAEVRWVGQDLAVEAIGTVHVRNAGVAHGTWTFPAAGGVLAPGAGGGSTAAADGLPAGEAWFSGGSVAVDGAGTEYLEHYGTVFEVGGDGLLHEVAAGLVEPFAIGALVVGPDGHLWRNAAGHVDRIDLVSGAVTPVAVAPPSDAGYWDTIAVDDDVQAYLSSSELAPGTQPEPNLPSTVDRIDAAGTVTLLAGTGDRWQGDGVVVDRQALRLETCPGEGCTIAVGRPQVTIGSGSVYVSSWGSPGVVTVDPLSGATSRRATENTLQVGDRPDGTQVLARWDFGVNAYEVIGRDPATGTEATLVSGLGVSTLVDVAPDGTVVALDQDHGLVTRVDPLGTSTVAAFTAAPWMQSILAGDGVVYGSSGDGLARLDGGSWASIADCATGDQQFRPRILAADGTVYGTVSFDDPPDYIESWRAWCHVDPVAGTAVELADPVAHELLLPVYAHEAPDGSVWGTGTDGAGPGLFRTRVPGGATVRLGAAFLPNADPHQLQIRVDGVPVGGPVGHAEFLAPVSLAGGTHTVSVTAVGDLDLSHYVVAYWGTCASDGTLVIGDGEDEWCVPLLFHTAIPLPTVAVRDAAVLRPSSGSAVLRFPVMLADVAFYPVTVSYTTVDGTASAAAGDYTPTSGTLHFGPGAPEIQYVSVPVHATPRRGLTQQLSLQLSAPTAATIADASGTGLVVDRKGPFVVAVGDATTVRSPTAPTTLTFPLRLNSPPSAGEQVTVSVATTDGTAAAPLDYTGVTTDVVFGPGESAKTVAVPVAAAPAATPTRTLALQLVGTSANAAVGDAEAIGTLRSAGVPAPPPTLTVSDAISLRQSGGASATFTVRLSAPAAGPVTVDVATEDGPVAVAGTDYTAVSGPLTFAPGETAKVVTVPVFPTERHGELDTFTLRLSNASGAGLADEVGTARLLNKNVARLTAWVADAAAVRSASVPSSATVTVTLASPPATGESASILVETVAGSAAEGVDYEPVSQVVVIPPGERTAVVTVPVASAAAGTPGRSFAVHLTAVTPGLVLADPDAVVRLIGP